MGIAEIPASQTADYFARELPIIAIEIGGIVVGYRWRGRVGSHQRSPTNDHVDQEAIGRVRKYLMPALS